MLSPATVYLFSLRYTSCILVSPEKTSIPDMLVSSYPLALTSIVYSANGCFSPGSMLYSIGGAKSSSRLTAPSESVTSSFIIESGLPVYDKVILAFASGAPCCLSYTFMCIFPLSIISCGVSIV